jgi:hypothetical protein
MLTPRLNTEARTEGAGDKPTVSQVALIRPLAGFCCGFAGLTILWPDWIEALTGYDPDQHDEAVEWLIALALCHLRRTGARREAAHRRSPL